MRLHNATTPPMTVRSLSWQRQVKTRKGKMLAAYRQIEMDTGVKGTSPPVVRETEKQSPWSWP